MEIFGSLLDFLFGNWFEILLLLLIYGIFREVCSINNKSDASIRYQLGSIQKYAEHCQSLLWEIKESSKGDKS